MGTRIARPLPGVKSKLTYYCTTHKTHESNTKRRWLAALLGAATGMVVFFLLYGTSTLHPTYDAWILNGYDEWDIQQHYAGWVLFRNSHWAFPLGLADTIAAPDGTVISFTDSIPWVSIFFKALRGVLPSTFQWFGWYTLFCFAMQGAAGALLCARGQAKNWRGSAGVFHTGRSAVCYAAYLVGARVPPYRAGQPVAVFAGAVCLSGIPSKPAQRHGQIPLGHAGAGLFWRWASTRTFCRWS